MMMALHNNLYSLEVQEVVMIIMMIMILLTIMILIILLLILILLLLLHLPIRIIILLIRIMTIGTPTVNYQKEEIMIVVHTCMARAIVII